MTENEFEKRFMAEMSEQQNTAVKAVQGAVLLLAVPGSGKTTVLITRLGYMINCCGISPSEILAVTYTRAATLELKKRFADRFGSECGAGLEIRTINGLSAKIIEYFSTVYTDENVPHLMSREGDRKRLISEVYRLVTGEFADTATINDISAIITFAKNMMLSDEEIEALSGSGYDTLRIYREYNLALSSRSLMDYDDQMVTALDILRKYPDILAYFNGRFRYICVDEAQDTSKIQHEIIRLLAVKSGNIFMVGDEDQSIYAFRGAYPEALTDFEKTYKNAQILFMEQNFRSTPEIIGVADSFVKCNRFRREKTIRAVNKSGIPVRIVRCERRNVQYDFLCGIAARNEQQTAALFRNNDSAVVLVDMLERNNIPYRLKGGEKTFFTSRPVLDITEIIRFINNPYDIDSFMAIYYKIGLYITKQTAEAACKISSQRHITITDALLGIDTGTQISVNSKRNIKQTAQLMQQAQNSSATEVLSIILHGMQYADYAHKNGLDENKYDILRMLARNVNSSAELIDRLSELSGIMAEHKDDPDSKFTLSTVHSSKGLEYDCVYLLDVIDNVLPCITKDKLNDKEDIKQYEEERRLFYVAVTRARKELYLFSCKGESSEFLDEIDKNLPIEYTDSNDIFFSLFARDMLGRVYCDSKNGRGIIIACCAEKLCIRYASGKTELKTLAEMLTDRDRKVETISTSSTEYFTKLAQLVASSDSPDMVRYEWQSYPHGVANNLYTSLDAYVDFDSDTWSGMKDMIENFNYGGKHYYLPYRVNPGVVLIYNQTALDDEGIKTDPLELYKEGKWTWTAWKDIMTEWCNIGDDYYGVMPTGFVAMPFIVSTGTTLIDVDGPNKQIINNMKNADVQRCQDFLADLANQGMVNSEYSNPDTCLTDTKTLFAEFGLDWGWTTAQAAAKDQDIRFVPIPRDDKADKYYTNTDTFGYLVPAGAKNIKAALKYMEICRLNEIDPELIAKSKAEMTAEHLYYPKCPECGVSTADKTIEKCPSCGAARRERKKHSAMSEDLYQIYSDLKDTTSDKFTFLFDDCFGFSTDLTNMLQQGDSEGKGCVLGGPFKLGESYTNLRDTYYGTVESFLEPYRALMQKN